MLGVQDSPLSRVTPRFHAVDEGDTVMSSTMTDRPMGGQSFPGMKRSSVLLRVSSWWYAAVQVIITFHNLRMVLWYLQREQVLLRSVNIMFSPLILEKLVFSAATVGEGGIRGVQLVAICNLTTRCQYIFHSGTLIQPISPSWRIFIVWWWKH